MSNTRDKSFLTDIDCDVQRELLQGATYYYGEPVSGVYALGDGVKYRLDQNLPDKRRVAYALATRTARGAKHAIFIVDTRQYNHLVYETASELREKLINRIKATIV